MKNLTELETKVVNHLSGRDEFDEMPADCFESIQDASGIEAKQLRGVLSSLIQKDVVITGEYPNGLECFYLCDKDFWKS